MNATEKNDDMSTPQTICGGIAVVIGMAILLPPVLSFGKAGQPLSLGQGLIVIIASYILFAIGATIGLAIHKHNDGCPPSK